MPARIDYTDGTKYCTKCNTTKSLNEFTFNKQLRPLTPCKQCRAERIKDKRNKNPEWRKEVDKNSRIKYNKYHTENGVDLIGDKFCNDCKRWYPKTEFSINRSSSSGFSSYCRVCAAIRSAQYRKSPFEFSRAEYDKFFEIQNGVCGICDKPAKNKRLDTDHNHKTGEVRGLLCGPHNMMLETMGENIEWIYKMADWIINNGVRNKVYTKGGELIDKTS